MRPHSVNGRAAWLALSLSWTGLWAAGCQRSPPPAPSPNGAESAAREPARLAPFPSTEAAVRPPAPCRALRVSGDVHTASGKTLATGSDLDGAEWLDLGKGSELVVQQGVSARELSLFGPGRAWPCRLGQEQVLLVEGRLESSPGTGVRPGAEVWVATPFGSVRYADAKLELVSRKDGVQLNVRSGQAFAESVHGLRGAHDGNRVVGPNGHVTFSGRADPEAAARACEHAAQTAASSAEQLLAAKPDELGKLAATQLRARWRARGRCLAAQAATASLTDAAERARLGDQVQRADALWQGVPASPEPPTRPTQ